MGSRVPGLLWRAGIAAGRHGPARIRRASRTLSAPNTVERLIAMSSRMDEDLRGVLFRGPLEGSDGSAARRVVADRLGRLSDTPLPATLYIDAKLALVDDMLHYFDRASMAHSLEVRVPFLDHRVVEYCAGIPAELKVRRLTTKYLLKRASRGILPDRIIDKRKIGFFAGVGRRLVPRPGGRRDHRVPAGSSATLCRHARSAGCPQPRPPACRCTRPGRFATVARDPDARGLALVLPSACAWTDEWTSGRSSGPSVAITGGTASELGGR